MIQDLFFEHRAGKENTIEKIVQFKRKSRCRANLDATPNLYRP